jgi:hypothetical protein
MAEQQNAAAFVAQQGSGGADPPAGAPPAETGDLVSRLTELARLRDGGFLSEAEFDVAKGVCSPPERPMAPPREDEPRVMRSG